jgi:O-antigen ligase
MLVQKNTIRFGLLLLTLFSAMLVIIMVQPRPMIVMGSAALVAGLAVFMIAFLKSKLAFLAFTFPLFALFDFLGQEPLISRPIKVYLADGTVFLLIVTFLRNAHSPGRLRSPITWLLIVNVVYGLLAIIIGLLAENELNSVLGDFRRLFFYPLATFISISYVRDARELRTLIIPFSLALLTTTMIGLQRVMTGQTWDPSHYGHGDDFRAFSYFSGSILVMGLGVFFGLSQVTSGWRKNACLCLSLVLAATGFLSGYRFLWIMIMAVVPLVSYLTFRGTRNWGWRQVSALAWGFAVIASAVILIRVFAPDVFLRFQNKVEVKILGFVFSENRRYYSWTTAWQRFLEAPVLGVGIGDEFTVIAPGSNGAYGIFHVTTHNILLTILYQAGLVGGCLFGFIHYRIIRHVWTMLKKVSVQARAPLAGMLAGYFSALGLGMVEPSLEAPGGGVAMYMWIGLMIVGVDLYAEKGKRLADLENTSKSSQPAANNLGVPISGSVETAR